MEWIVTSGVLAALIVAAVTIWKTVYKRRNPRPKTSASANAGVIVQVVHAPAAPTDPPPITLPTIDRPTRPSPGVRIVEAPALPVDPLDFAPVASSDRYQNVADPVSREEALMEDLYRVSGNGLRVEDPIAVLDEERDS